MRTATRVSATVEGGLLRLSIPATPYQRTYQGDAVPVPRVSVHAMAAGAGPPPGHPSENADLLPAVPGVVTSELARRADAGVGGTVTVSTADGEQPITVVGIALALPSVPGGTAGALVDLPTLTERRLAVTRADPAALAPSRSR
ncbi:MULTISPECIES: hypothetical protein [Actinomadura]|uniref:hypothetical protein n=1 Tax=Actinomadura TaxID=1988 RepID=UPI0026100E2D|nr:hypothetical protein [Actinomadura geliboluensis]